MRLSGRLMDADERLTVGINVERIFSNAPCQDIAGGLRGSPIV